VFKQQKTQKIKFYAIYKGRGTFFFKVGPIRKHWQFHVKFSAIEDTSVGSHS
jgi:hypothetical protein